MSQAETNEYLARVNELFQSIQAMLESLNLGAHTTRVRDEAIREEDDSYSAPVLGITVPGMDPVEVVPRGHMVLDAEGRADVRGSVGSEILLLRGGEWVFPMNYSLGEYSALSPELIHRLLTVVSR